MKMIINALMWAIVLLLSACGDKIGSKQVVSDSTSAPVFSPSQSGANSTQNREVNSGLNGVVSFKIVGLKNYVDEDRCELFFEAKNSSANTFSMTLDVTFKSKEGQVIDSALRVLRIRGGKTITTDIPTHEKCSLVGAMAITNTNTCEIDGNMADGEVCWNALDPVPGVLPLIK